MGKQLWGATLVYLNVCLLLANNTVEALAEACQRQSISGCAVKYKKYLAVGVEHLTYFVTGLLSVFVVSIGSRVIVIGIDHGAEYFWANTCVVITTKMLLGFGLHNLNIVLVILETFRVVIFKDFIGREQTAVHHNVGTGGDRI